MLAVAARIECGEHGVMPRTAVEEQLLGERRDRGLDTFEGVLDFARRTLIAPRHVVLIVGILPQAIEEVREHES